MDLCDLVYRAVYSNARLENVMLIRTIHGEDLDSIPRSLYYERWETLRDLFPGRTVTVLFQTRCALTEPVALPWTEEATEKVRPHVRVAAIVQGDRVTVDFRYSPRLDYGDAPPGCECGSLSVADCTCVNEEYRLEVPR